MLTKHTSQDTTAHLLDLVLKDRVLFSRCSSSYSRDVVSIVRKKYPEGKELHRAARRKQGGGRRKVLRVSVPPLALDLSWLAALQGTLLYCTVCSLGNLLSKY